jgi:chromate reductase, NAD(P)H dehydrogenase (quinone)
MSDLQVLGISGSLRKGSYNTALLRAAGGLLPDGISLTLQLLHEIPLYDGDVEAKGLPAGVVALREAIRSADGVLISTPEYNNSMPGVLKNAVDWVSRGKDQPFAGKPVALVSASNGRFGGARSQVAWMPTLAVLGTLWMHRPQFYLANGQDAFAPDGSLVDERTRELLRGLLAQFAVWCRAHAGVRTARS